MTENQYNPAEQAELAQIYIYWTKLVKAPDSQLKVLALNEIDKKQPALQNLARFLYLTKKFTIKQMMEITRLITLVWWYYKDRLEKDSPRIAEPLYVRKRIEWELFMEKMEGKGPKENKTSLEEHLKNYPARLLYGVIRGLIQNETTGILSSLSGSDKTYLLIHFKIIMDCFESLRNEQQANYTS